MAHVKIVQILPNQIPIKEFVKQTHVIPPPRSYSSMELAKSVPITLGQIQIKERALPTLALFPLKF